MAARSAMLDFAAGILAALSPPGCEEGITLSLFAVAVAKTDKPTSLGRGISSGGCLHPCRVVLFASYAIP